MAFPADRCSGDFLVAANNPSCPTTFRPSAISDSHRPGANFVARNFPDACRLAGAKAGTDWRGSTVLTPQNEPEASTWPDPQGSQILACRPEKWEPVFGKDYAPTNK